MGFSINIQEIFTRLVKYIVEGTVVAIVAYMIPDKPLHLMEIILLALTAAFVFSVLDAYAPSMGASARTGTGLGLGIGLSGLPLMF